MLGRVVWMKPSVVLARGGKQTECPWMLRLDSTWEWWMRIGEASLAGVGNLSGQAWVKSLKYGSGDGRGSAEGFTEVADRPGGEGWR